MKTVKAPAAPAIQNQLSALAAAESELRAYFRAVKKSDRTENLSTAL
jgi:hypothetical protein